MSWITAILQLYSQVADLFGHVIVKRINIRLFDLLARFHYILNLPRTIPLLAKSEISSLCSRNGSETLKTDFLMFIIIILNNLLGCW